MPTTPSGAKVKKKLQDRYGAKKGEETYYALMVEGKGGKGKHRWEGTGGTGKLAKAKRTYSAEHKGSKKNKGTLI